MRKRTSESRGDPGDDAPSPWGRSLLSLLLIVHLFCVAVALSSNYSPSPLQTRLLERFQFYLRTLNFDLNFTPYYLTHAMESDVDHRIEVLPQGENPAAGESWVVLPGSGWHGGQGYKRLQRLGQVMAFYSQDDATAALFAQAVGRNFLQQRGVTPQQIRCRRHMLQSRLAVEGGSAVERDPNSATYFRTPYIANCVVADGEVQIVRLDEAGEVAQPRGESAKP